MHTENITLENESRVALLQNTEARCMAYANDCRYYKMIRDIIFSLFPSLGHEINVSANGQHLNIKEAKNGRE